MSKYPSQFVNFRCDSPHCLFVDLGDTFYYLLMGKHVQRPRTHVTGVRFEFAFGERWCRQLDGSLSCGRCNDGDSVPLTVERSVLVRNDEIWPDATFERRWCENNAALCVRHLLGVFSEIWNRLCPAIAVVPVDVVAVLRFDLLKTYDVSDL